MPVTAKKFNKEYFNIWKEVPLFFVMWVQSIFLPTRIESKRTLIVIPCLIGEFVACIPALVDFAKRNPERKIDLLVTPQLEGIAQKVVGIDTAYTCGSVYGRNEAHNKERYHLPAYDKAIVLRISKSAYDVLAETSIGEIETHGMDFLAYALHLFWNLLLGKTPKRWRTFNFELLGGLDKIIPFDEMFAFNDKDREKIQELLSESSKKKILIHTSANWPNKNWDNEKWIDLLEKIHVEDDVDFIFIGSAEDVASQGYIARVLSFETQSLVHKTQLEELPLLFSRADFFIGVDSGPSNIAHLVGLPNITLVGVSPNMYLSPSERDVVIDKTKNRGILYMFFARRNNALAKVSANEVYQAFRVLVGNN
jgi:ADP-heptose:LPS heptosyltransferase